MKCVAILLALLVACSDSSGPKPPGDGVLFIGNSLTYYNDMPMMVKAFADSTDQPMKLGVVAYGDYALVDHWNEGTSRAAIAKGGWKYVVLQQGPSAVSYNRDSLRLLSAMFAGRMAAVGARPALYSVWPQVVNSADFAASMQSYALAAADVDGLLLPVAAAWLATWDLDSSIELYDSDGVHPNAEGSYLAALVIYSRLFNRSPVGLPTSLTLSEGYVLAIDPAVAVTLQQAAASVTTGASETTGRR